MAPAEFADHFSGHAEEYRSYRPTYPESLFDHLAGLVPDRGLAWDCATGSGQAATLLADFFRRVVATDASREQLGQAELNPRVRYVCSLAEATPFPDRMAGMVTVAQALHWFDRPAFYREARRVLVPGGVLATWCYDLFRIHPDIDPLLDAFSGETVGEYWPAERRLVEERYRTIEFPFEEIDLPPFRMQVEWDLDRVLGYMRTWSSVRRYQTAAGRDPVAGIEERFRDLWGDVGRREIVWALHFRVGRASG